MDEIVRSRGVQSEDQKQADVEGLSSLMQLERCDFAETFLNGEFRHSPSLISRFHPLLEIFLGLAERRAWRQRLRFYE
ncbi:hypothetical protein D3C80_1739530 [compost metagenome]